MGRLAEGWKEMEIRNDPRFRSYTNHMTKSPYWNGENLDGKRVLVLGEQGLGDEFMFANVLPDLQRAVGETGKLQISVDPRLVTLFQRSYPKADVGTYDDRTVIDPDGKELARRVGYSPGSGPEAFIEGLDSTAILETVRTGSSGIGRGERILKV